MPTSEVTDMLEVCRFHQRTLPCAECNFDGLYKPKHYGELSDERHKLYKEAFGLKYGEPSPLMALLDDTEVTGSDNPYYEFNGATCFAELVELRNMSFNRGSIGKSWLRWDDGKGLKYNLEKIQYYVERELAHQETQGKVGINEKD